ncbi:hypothetical protein BST81_12620 [Leptolyngbya sp. 'hensonii']|uniref:hypothetical protein n=1 Tax=Leptolyngbya sp. 'hensonii' TaxID=1922337 RepID=UPI00094FD5BB|nr:hypothetical protein [Leptolyngbya sp. 'hensonii']OLP17896.1 hypothetical protein BST81_12620 [Leptolyngbya sp. 'hensonii']
MDSHSSKPSIPDDRPQVYRPLPPINWIFWLAFTVMLPCGLGIWAISSLLQVPNSANCYNMAPTAPAAARLYCAETLAGAQTAEDLEQAIALAASISPEDPLRSAALRLMGQWSIQLLHFAEVAFQEGNLDRAINLADAVPREVPTRKTADASMQQWQTIWKKAEAIYAEVEAELEKPDTDKEKWARAIAKARQLWVVGNQYWATVRYQELADQIWIPTADQNSLKKSAKNSAGPKISSLEDLIKKRNKERQSENQGYLSKARTLASSGRLNDLRDAIAEASQVFSDGPEYEEAQRLMATWRQQAEVLEDREYLDRATALARRGDADSLQAAIDEARWITLDRPLYQEAGSRIEQWTTRLIELQNTAGSGRNSPTSAPEPYRLNPIEPASNPDPHSP